MEKKKEEKNIIEEASKEKLKNKPTEHKEK